MATSVTKHPLRTLTLIAVLAGIVLAIKNSIADKGGSYLPPAPARTAATRPDVATRPATANDVVDDATDEEPAIAAALDEEFGRDRIGARDRPHDEASSDGIARTKIDPFGIR